MVSQRFRIKIPIIAIVMENGLHTTRYTEADDVVTIVCGPLDGVRLVEVKWKERIALIFTKELRDHAELLSETPTPAQEVCVDPSLLTPRWDDERGAKPVETPTS